jgi:hypothetical protein
MGIKTEQNAAYQRNPPAGMANSPIVATAAQGHRAGSPLIRLGGMSTRPRSQAGPPMTLGNMRANGVRSLDACCWECHHRAILNAALTPVARSRDSAIVRPAHGVHGIRRSKYSLVAHSAAPKRR